MRNRSRRAARALPALLWLALALGAGPAAAAPDCTVALWGDSILYGGFGASLANRIKEPPAAALKRIRPAWTIADYSSPGDSAHKRLPTFVMQPMPARVVVLQYGINDAGNNYQYEPALRGMVDYVQAARKTSIVTGLSQVKADRMPQRDGYDATARRVAQEEGVLFADWGAARFDPADMVDDIHPQQPYSTRLVERLVLALDQIAPECASPAKRS
ncbi:lysophospholipase L1-like esterase [Variovorax boronicumulans]|uniref:SGNH/GDSL hydrolase family protein n=1 Tax=Variovorax boronicumulans TaxID=436515 RepID=UPI00277F2432|nr:SGNH/GDSL hydrolase family protein [Variovorax boronicumulans]MDQ0069575.1 lysophospholipase L1-like esterase [Variovorax boronicumulans]